MKNLRRFIALFLFLAAIFSSGCSMPNGPFGFLGPSGGLHGTITDINGAPVNGASVSLIGDESTYSARTGTDGKYNISGVPAGMYNIVVEKEGYDNTTAYDFEISEDYPSAWSAVLNPAGTYMLGGLNITVRAMRNVLLENASILLIGNSSTYKGSTDKSGKYNFSGVPAGEYEIVAEKQGYRHYSFNLTIFGGTAYPWSVILIRDCSSYAVNTSVDYTLKYGYNVTIYRGYMTYLLDYPEGAEYSVSPAPDGSLSEISTVYRAGNRMLSWKLNNSKGTYPSVQAYLHVNMKGTQAMRLFNRTGMKIPDAAASQPAFLGSETNAANGRTMIDPSDSGIKAIAGQVKGETKSNDTWAVAQALFAWLNNNTDYYHGPESDKYTQSATEVLRSRRGDCDELSSLYISLCRAAGIPARFVDGYAVEKDESGTYAAHEWVEFYDGEWVPVEVSSSGNRTYENGVIRGQKGDMAGRVNTRFGISAPDHIKIFVDDGTSESIITDNGKGSYHDKPPSLSRYIYYSSRSYNQMYIVSCSDGTRVLANEEG